MVIEGALGLEFLSAGMSGTDNVVIYALDPSSAMDPNAPTSKHQVTICGGGDEVEVDLKGYVGPIQPSPSSPSLLHVFVRRIG